MSKKKDLIVVGVLLAAALVLHALSALLPEPDLTKKTADAALSPDAIEFVEPTSEPAGEKAQAEFMGPMPKAQTQKVLGHVVLTVAGRQYGDPIPMDRDKIITLNQEDGKINKVHITPEKVFMETSTCDNQDCVMQGEITAENYQKRVLKTFVICMPNDVTIEFIPAE